MKLLRFYKYFLLVAFVIVGCNNDTVVNNNDDNINGATNDFLTPVYTVTLTVYQKANYTPNSDFSSTAVLVNVGQISHTWYANGQADDDWVGIYTNPQTWQDAGGTYTTTGFKITYNITWTNGSEYEQGIFRVGSGNPNTVIYNYSLSCTNGSGSNTSNVDPASSLQVNSAYSIQVGYAYLEPK